MLRAFTYLILFLLGIMVGNDFNKPEIVYKVISRPVEMVFQEDCFDDNLGQLKHLTVEDLVE